MPTGARLMSAIMLALAMMGAIWLAAWHDPSIGAAARNRLMLPGAVAGALFGWWMLGGRLGRGFLAAMGWAITTMITAGFWFLAFLALRSTTFAVLAGQHRGRPVQALEALVDQFLIYLWLASDIRVLLAAAVGALIAGAMGEYARMIWN